jgi:hypothetical protein
VSRNIKILWCVNSYAYAHAVRIGETGKWQGKTLWQERKKKNGRKERMAGNTARNKKAMVIAFLFRCCKTARAARAQFYIQGENWGHGGKERAIGPFFSPDAVL